MQARELENEFEAVFGIEHANYHPKPLATAFKKVFNLANVTPNNSAMFEDDHRNLEVPAQLGMKTVFVSSEQKIPNYVDVFIQVWNFSCHKLSQPAFQSA